LIVLDTSVLIGALAGPRKLATALRRSIEEGHRMGVPAMVLFEWLRGPRHPEELAAQEALFPSEFALPFDALTASIAADLYRRVSRPKGRELDLAIAAHAIVHEAELWTVNARDFRDLPGLRLYHPSVE
jgi:predicted nucleic acid-binding protein